MPTLLLSPRYTPDSIRIREAAAREGWKVERLASWRANEELKDEDVVLYGEPLFCAFVAQELGLALIEPPFEWLIRIPREYSKRNIEYSTLGRARSGSKPAFVKPADDKCFRAAVYKSGKDLPQHEALEDSIPVLISEPVEWEVEYRCFVCERQVNAVSVYFRGGELAQLEDGNGIVDEAEQEEASDFAKLLLADRRVESPPAVVIDVGKIEGMGWAVVESNPAWASGIYGCDPAGVLPSLQRGCMRIQDVRDDDKKWILERGRTT